MEKEASAVSPAVERRLARLTVTVVVLALLWVVTLGWVVLAGRAIPPVIAVERLEIREPDGALAFALANSARPTVGMMDGEVLMADQANERRHPNFIFFDGRGDEVGGLMLRTQETPAGTAIARFMTFDAYKQDEAVILGHTQGPAGTVSGLRVEDRPRDVSLVESIRELGLEPGFTRADLQAAIDAVPEEERPERLRSLFSATRVLLGSRLDDAAALTLHDGQGRPRIVLEVPADGEPSIRILDAAGTPVFQLPQ